MILTNMTTENSKKKVTECNCQTIILLMLKKNFFGTSKMFNNLIKTVAFNDENVRSKIKLSTSK